MSEAFCDDRLSAASDDVEATLGELRREAKIRQTLPWFLSAVLHALVVLAGFWMTFLVIQSEDEPRPIAVRSDFEALAFAPVRMPTESVDVTASRSASLESPTLDLPRLEFEAPSLPASAAGNGAFALVKENLQGRLRWLGVNLGQSRVEGRDNPMNSLKIGQSPIVLRLSRTIPAAGVKTPRGESNTNSAKSAANINVFAETVKLMTIQNGEIMISSL